MLANIQKFKTNADKEIEMLQLEEQKHAERVKELSKQILATEGGIHGKKGKRPLAGDALMMHSSSTR